MSELDNAKLRRLGRLILLARAVLLWERVWPRLWPFLIVSSLFIICILFDVFAHVPSAVHVLALGGFGFGLLGCLIVAFHGLAWPGVRDGLRRLESDSGFTNQPLFSLLDHPVPQPNNKMAQTIWLNHQDRMAAAMDKIVLKGPRSTLYKRDPYSLRAALILLLVLGAIEARSDVGARLSRAFAPASHSMMAQDWDIQAWINPPSYTGLGPVYLKATPQSEPASTPISIVQHSDILLHVEGAPTRDDIELTNGPFVEKLSRLGKGSFSLETSLDQGDVLRISRGGEILYHWPIQIIADMPPQISIRDKPKTGFRGHFSVDYKAEDDFGLQEVAVIIRPLVPDGRPDIVLNNKIQGRTAKGTLRRNLAAHPWAGRNVVMTPKVTDSAGQSALGESVQFILPQRQFTHPLAMRLIEIRKSLYESGPDDRVFAGIWLDRLSENPQDFNYEVAIYLGLRVASKRLRISMDEDELESVRSILWESAVRLEEGAAGNARNQLEFMSRQMQEMMQAGQDKAAMEALFEQMAQSLDQYLQKMGQSMPDMEGFEEFGGLQNADMVGRDELMELLQRARELMRTGNTKAAQALLNQFQSILSRLAMQPPPDPAQMKAARELMQQLKSVQERQQKLLDQTFQRTRNQDRPSIASTKKAILEAQEQQRIRDLLRQQMEKLRTMKTQISKELQSADEAMKRAVSSLERGLDEDAVQSQMRALDQLREGLKNSAQSLAQKMGMQTMPRQMPGYDPLGRRSGKGAIESETGQTVPTESEMKKSREILQELYQRAGQKGRTDQELKYIERLLERF